MKVYITDEIAYEISEHDVPDQLAATGPGELSSPRWATMTPEQEEGRLESIKRLDDFHLIGAIEGWLAATAFEQDKHGWVPVPNEPDMMMKVNIGGQVKENRARRFPIEPEHLDDPEYPARRRITRMRMRNEWYGDTDDTIVLEARFGRNKKWVMAVNRRIPELGRIALTEWIDNETREE